MSEPTARVMRFTCEDHGEIWSTSVWCQHDTEDAARSVSLAHRAVYGADCTAVITIELLDPETMRAVETSRNWADRGREEGERG